MENARKKVLDQRKQLNEIDKSTYDSSLNDTLYNLFSNDFYRSKAVLCFYPLSDEINLLNTYKMLLAKGYKLYFPKTFADGTMDFYLVNNFEKDLTEGAFHVMEPKDLSEKYNYSDYGFNQTFMILPGAVFDESCFRMGYGKGFYDKYLSDKEGIIKCALAYDFQVLPEIPHESWDVPMDIVITPKRIFYRAIML